MGEGVRSQPLRGRPLSQGERGRVRGASYAYSRALETRSTETVPQQSGAKLSGRMLKRSRYQEI